MIVTILCSIDERPRLRLNGPNLITVLNLYIWIFWLDGVYVAHYLLQDTQGSRQPAPGYMKRGSGRNLGPGASCVLLFKEKLVSHVQQQSLTENQQTPRRVKHRGAGCIWFRAKLHPRNCWMKWAKNMPAGGHLLRVPIFDLWLPQLDGRLDDLVLLGLLHDEDASSRPSRPYQP